MKTFYTYFWLREDGTPYYVGKGTGKRALRKGCPPGERVLIQEHSTEADAFAAEKFFISYYGRKDRGGILINLTDGGEGVSGWDRSQEWRILHSQQMTGRHPSEETRRKMSEWQVGKELSEETKKKISNRAIARENTTAHMNTPEARAKKSESLKGRVFSTETIETMKKAAVLRNQKFGNPMTGRKHSAKTKEKIRQAALARKGEVNDYRCVSV